MDFWKAIFGLVRRGTVGPPLALAALASAVLVFLLMPASYVSSASMVLATPVTGGTLPAESTGPLGLTNPLLQFSDGLRVTAGILILSMNTPEIAAELGVAEEGSTKITINDGRTNPNLLGISTNGPFVYVEVESTSAATARDVVARAKERIRKELTTRQDELRAPRSTFISAIDVVPSSTPEVKLSGKVAAAGGALFLVVVVGIALAYGLIQVRGSGRSAAPARPSGSPESANGAREAGFPDRGAEVPGKPLVTVYPGLGAEEREPSQNDSGPVGESSVCDDGRSPDPPDTAVFTRAGGRDNDEK